MFTGYVQYVTRVILAEDKVAEHDEHNHQEEDDANLSAHASLLQQLLHLPLSRFQLSARRLHVLLQLLEHDLLFLKLAPNREAHVTEASNGAAELVELAILLAHQLHGCALLRVEKVVVVAFPLALESSGCSSAVSRRAGRRAARTQRVQDAPRLDVDDHFAAVNFAAVRSNLRARSVHPLLSPFHFVSVDMKSRRIFRRFLHSSGNVRDHCLDVTESAA
mmetsp:Transcript_13964/g.34942  ORF Transcript_13964/g.34942 Transcript_13964/m.34942 type:complete len:220 (-) Transcript_13964:297-956(-)